MQTGEELIVMDNFLTVINMKTLLKMSILEQMFLNIRTKIPMRWLIQTIAFKEFQITIPPQDTKKIIINSLKGENLIKIKIKGSLLFKQEQSSPTSRHSRSLLTMVKMMTPQFLTELGIKT